MAAPQSMTNVRKLLSAAPSLPPSSTPSPTQNSPKPTTNKRKAAFQAWHQKKLAEIEHETTEKKSRSSPPVSNSPTELLDQLVKSSLPSMVNAAGGSDNENGQKHWHVSRNLTAPKLSRHNDAAYYPNIQCILCNEWVCSRNRYMHIESHLQYRPYKCSVCGYDNRKEIFINLHIKRSHLNSAQVIYQPDPSLEKRAWQLAEQCLQHTREILVKEDQKQKADSAQANQSQSSKAKVDTSLLAPYADVYRPKIFNSQRAEKSQLIEESRQLGLVPDFTEVASMESKCQICSAHILSHHAVLEEHARTHLSRPSYRCNIEECVTEHHSKNFLNRHMKEVHKYRRAPFDLLDNDKTLARELSHLCEKAFPAFFNQKNSNKIGGKHHRVSPTAESAPTLVRQLAPRQHMCALCKLQLQDDCSAIYEHVKSHLSVAPFACKLCHATAMSKRAVAEHVKAVHPDRQLTDALKNRMTHDVAQQCTLLLSLCFPAIGAQPALHQEIYRDLSE